jgi:hypothetical protein
MENKIDKEIQNRNSTDDKAFPDFLDTLAKYKEEQLIDFRKTTLLCLLLLGNVV